MRSGRLLLIANNSTIRRDLKAFLSDDDGKTWKYSLKIDSRYWVSYPDAVEDEDGVLKVVYDFERKPTGTIYYLTFSENDILTGNEKNIKKVVVNTLL
ncbi:exo-alpha-sialidase [Flavobacterium sp. P21]|uniref:exo-alpha-sialidase n=1 Tax=Flavobacterium sp. P21 TaxID=3423948 RepID=UPI003D66E4E2